MDLIVSVPELTYLLRNCHIKLTSKVQTSYLVLSQVLFVSRQKLIVLIIVDILRKF